MQLPEIIEQSGQRVLTTAQLAEAYGTDVKTISWNFNHNKERYEEGKHFYYLKGEDLKDFFAVVNFTNAKKIRSLYLWTEYGALLHAKSLNTDKAWEVYSYLIEHYFRAKAETKPAEPDYSGLSPQLQFMIQMEQRQNALESRQNELESRMQATEQQIDKGLQNAYTEGYAAAHSVPFSLQKNFAEFVRRKARVICAKLPGGYERHGISITRNLYGRIRKEFHVQSYTELNLDQMEKAIDLVNDMTFERLVLKS